jgi:hypothetical protein
LNLLPREEIMPGLYDTLFGREGQFKQSANMFNPQQQQILNQILGMGAQGLGTDAIEGRARQGFQKNTIPLLSERFANIAGRGLSGIGSSGYQNALQGAGTDLETNLAALRQGNAMNLLGLGLTPQQETYFEPGSEGIAGPLALLAGDAAATYFTGGANKAGSIMDLFKSLFGGNKEKPSSYTGIEAEATSPLRQRLAGQSPMTSLGQAYGGSMNKSLFSSGGSRFEQPLAQNAPQAMNQFRNGGTASTISAINQAYDARLPSAAQNAYRNTFLNKFYPGFEL